MGTCHQSFSLSSEAIQGRPEVVQRTRRNLSPRDFDTAVGAQIIAGGCKKYGKLLVTTIHEAGKVVLGREQVVVAHIREEVQVPADCPRRTTIFAFFTLLKNVMGFLVVVRTTLR